MADGAYVGDRIAVLPNMVVFVQNVPTAATDVNHTAGTTPPAGRVGAAGRDRARCLHQ